MREANLERLKTTDINLNYIWYLHDKPYHEDLLEAFKLYAKGRLIDIGCGNKPNKNTLQQYITDYKGCDIIQSSEELVDIFRHNY